MSIRKREKSKLAMEKSRSEKNMNKFITTTEKFIVIPRRKTEIPQTFVGYTCIIFVY